LEVSYHEEEFEDDIDEDIAIRALLEGWDAVVKQHGGRLSQSWSKLRSIDEVIFGRCDPKERLAILRLMHALMRFHITQTDDARRKVPHWYLQRPSQALAHSYAIDFFAWYVCCISLDWWSLITAGRVCVRDSSFTNIDTVETSFGISSAIPSGSIGSTGFVNAILEIRRLANIKSQLPSTTRSGTSRLGL
jgi:hypothetical protein